MTGNSHWRSRQGIERCNWTIGKCQCKFVPYEQARHQWIRAPQQVSVSNQDEVIKFEYDFSMFDLLSVRGKDFSIYSMMIGCRNFDKKGSGSC